MGWEWIGPLATATTGGLGIFFTWLSGVQNRKQVEEITSREQERTDRERLRSELVELHMTALRYGHLTLRHVHYLNSGDTENLAILERRWPKEVRIQEELDIFIKVQLLGNRYVQDLGQRWYESTRARDEEKMRTILNEAIAFAQKTLDIDVGASTPSWLDSHA